MTPGALGTFAFCSPTGLFDLSEASIGPTTEVGTATVDGQQTTEYAVTIDPTSFLDAPGISAGESQAMQSAISLLGDGSILDDVYVDGSGDIVRTVSNIDGVSLQVDLSNFGGAGTVTLPPQQPTIDSSTTLPGSSVRNCLSTSGSGQAVGGAVTGGPVSTTTTIPTTSETTAATTMTTLTTPTTTQCNYREEVRHPPRPSQAGVDSRSRDGRLRERHRMFDRTRSTRMSRWTSKEVPS